ncbi:hypothetical protein TraAM80_07346 [Trypanosoma rangeli]|uniref:Uncharacterized protein n=1 Tax=Trypanosoma rangeli TaxID=5698 RepID=A0A3R7ME95_TRYRA|nr:uncharacterized protein TraAM80_07346 [Trypanosoma rangeli]RNF00946.1 hypothetical protein TraAM80_07346 [Trypanosoma rangeli]|eukprot:RNF00946.1 hypothetical protein TraAM80_07346 [Trypanosoma rangeli]
MPSSSKAKEEAELRKIARQARLSRKEAAAKERRRVQRGRSAAEPTAVAATDSNTHRRRGALVLPAEVEELRQRISSAPSASSSSSSSRRSRLEEPPYGMEVHHKKKQIIVTVTLHHVPPAHVDVSETTDERLVVDTSKHTKKYRLELPIPDGMRVNAEEAACEMNADNGVLTCVLPIRGDIAESLQTERAKMLDDIRKQKSLRFRISADGELKVRSRQALLAKSERAQAALMEQKKRNKVRVEQDAVEAEETTGDEDKAEVAVTAATGDAGKRKTNKNSAPEEEEEPAKKRSKKETALALCGGTANAQGFQKGSGTIKKQSERHPSQLTGTKAAAGSAFDEEHKKAMEIAKSAGKAARMTLRESIAQANARQKKMQERISVRTSRRSLRTERTQDSFARILEEQKQQLLARAELNASMAASEKKAAADRKEGGKTVTFAAVEE